MSLPYTHYFNVSLLSSTGSKKHLEGRNLLKLFLSGFKTKGHDNALTQRIQSNLWASICDGEQSKKKTFANVTREEIQTMVSSALFMLFLDIDFKMNADEKGAVLTLYARKLGLIVPNGISFLLGGFKLEREYLSQFMAIRKAFIRGKDTEKMIKFVHYCDEHKLDVSTALNTVTSTFIVAALGGTETPIWFAIEKFREDSRKYGDLYSRNKIAFIKESVRYLGFNPGVTSYVLPKDMKLRVAGKDRTFYEGTNVLIQMGLCNRDVTIFGGEEESFEYADSFDPTRENLDKILSWNAMEEYVMTKDEKAAPRQCPGHDMALFVAILILDMFQPDPMEADI